MRARAGLLAGAVLCLMSCGGDGVVSTVVGPPPVAGPKLAELQSSIFTPKCAIPGCHALPAPEQGMNLAAGNTFTYTVGVDATELSGFKRVVPGIAADSYLYMKIAADPRIVGERMPFGGMLTADEIDKVKAWIDAGALDN